MPKVIANTVALEYERSGPPDGTPLLLIHGVGAQLTQWPDEYCASFAARGFSVIRYDSRDIGLSTHFDSTPIPDLATALAARARGDEPDIPYALEDLADDAAGLLDALSIEKAHIFGVSLGGMVGQMLAIRHPGKVASLTVVMSTSGNPNLPESNVAILTRPIPDLREDEEGFLEASVAQLKALGGSGYPIDEQRLRSFAGDAAKRAYNPAGVARLFVAGRTAADRRSRLNRLSVPALIIHGTDDPIIPIEAGADIANNIRGSYFVQIDGLGHDLPPQLADSFASLAALNAGRQWEREHWLGMRPAEAG